MSTTPQWLSRALACPTCHGPLAHAADTLRCRSCGPYPRLAGIPVLVPDPAAWCATYRESILAALAEAGLATGKSVSIIDAFAAGAPHAEPRHFGDDWTSQELTAAPLPEPVKGAAAPHLRALMTEADERSVRSWLVEHATGDTVLELGCGAGVTSALLAKRHRRLIVADLSLRAVLVSRRRAGAPGVVCDATALPFASRALHSLVAENVIDLLDDPVAFLEGARRAVRARGRALLSTPDPALGTDDDAALDVLAARAGFRAFAHRDGVPWLRVHSGRSLEVYVVRCLGLEAAPVKR